MSERKSVTRSDFRIALGNLTTREHADAIFDALPATPAASTTLRTVEGTPCRFMDIKGPRPYCSVHGGWWVYGYCDLAPLVEVTGPETVDAAWEALAFALDDYADERLADQQLAIRREVAAQLLVEHRPRIEAAIRAEVRADFEVIGPDNLAYLTGLKDGRAESGLEADGDDQWSAGYDEGFAAAKRLCAALERTESVGALDVEQLRATIHNLRWCKWSDTLHAIAHDDEDEDGYRAAFISEYARLAEDDKDA